MPAFSNASRAIVKKSICRHRRSQHLNQSTRGLGGSRANQRNLILMEVMRSFSTELDADKLLVALVAWTTKALEAHRSSLFLVDRQTKELWSRVSEGEGLSEIRIPRGAGIVGHVTESGKGVRIDDAYRDSRFDQDTDHQSGYRTLTILCVPMYDETGQVVGAVECINKLSGTFTSEDEELLGALAAQAGVALRVAHAVQARERQLQQQFLELQITVDRPRQASQVSQIVDSDYFQGLQAKASKLKKQLQRASS